MSYIKFYVNLINNFAKSYFRKGHTYQLNIFFNVIAYNL